MKKILGVVLALTFLGCMATKYYAPPGKDIQLMKVTEEGKIKVKKRVWYALWGLVPITDNSISDVVNQYNLKKVKAHTYYGVMDWIINFFTGWVTIYTITIEIEGEPAQ